MAGAEGSSLDAASALSGEIPFVGRERSRALLERWLEAAVAGEPRVGVISGPAGIGKTRLIGWCGSLAAELGVAVHAGSGLAGANVPYLPIRTAFADLHSPTGTSLGESLDFSSAPPEVPATVTTAASGQRLVEVTESLVEAARETPRLIVIDDVQWADQPSLDLLAQIATVIGHRASSGPVPVMLLLGGRTGDPGEPHERLWASLEREPNTRRLDLGGLDHLELIALIEAIGGAPPAPELALQVADAVDGNPLQTQSILRRLLSTGAVTADGRLRATSPGPLRLEVIDLDDELSRRLDSVSENGREVMTVAAGLGDGGTLVDLAIAAAIAPAALDRIIDELDDAGLLHDDGTTYHFAQGQLRQVVLRRLTHRRRQALHLRIADRLIEAHGADSAAHALTLAEHLCRAQAPPERIVEVCGVAGDRATALDLWGKAAQFYEAALAASKALDTPVPQASAWNLGAGFAHFNRVDLARAEPRLHEAIETAAPDDLNSRGRAALVLVRCRLTQGAVQPGQLVDLTEIHDFLDAAEAKDVEPGLRALALGLMAESFFAALDLETGFEYSGRARRLSSQVGDDAVTCMVEVADGIQHLGSLRLDDAADCFSRSLDHGRRADPGLPLAALVRQALVSWLRGDLDTADDLLRQSVAATEPRHQWGELSFATACRAGLAALRNQHREAERLAERASRLCRVSNYLYAPAQLYPALAWSRAMTGDRVGAHHAIDEWRGGPGRGGATFRPVIDALAGVVDAAPVPSGWYEPIRDDPSLLDVSALAGRVELGDALGDRRLIEVALEPIESLVASGVVFALDRGSFLPRLAGVAALGVGELDRAEAHLERAEATLTTRADLPGELARCRLDLARVLVARDDRGDRRAAGALLDLATTGFDELGWLPFVTRAARVREALPDPGARAAAPSASVRTILTTDLVSSTQLNVRLGDVDYVRVLADHDRLARARFRHHGGVEFKHTGDGFFAWFASADDAVAAATGIQRDLDEWRELHPETEVRVRCGLAAGRPVEVGDDLFGASVAQASRVCALAGGDEVLCSADVVELLSDEAARGCEAVGEFDLKGFPEAVTVYRSIDVL